MIPEVTVALHVGHGQETTLSWYLYRVVLSLVALGGASLLVYWSLEQLETARRVLASGDDAGEVEDRG